jgi:Na+-translocating ferredoxin:NAD+ oxidoreductase RnfA subunit
MVALLMVLLSSVLVTTVVLAHMPQWRPFVAPTDIFGGARIIAIVCLVAVPVVALLGWLLARFVLAPWHLEYLRTPVLVAVVLIVVPLLDVASAASSCNPAAAARLRTGDEHEHCAARHRAHYRSASPRLSASP